MSTFDVVCAIHAERLRQDAAEGFTVDHDDEHRLGELASAAASYLLLYAAAQRVRGDPMIMVLRGAAEVAWPWNVNLRRPEIDRQTLVIAGALDVAEVERVDRRDGQPRGKTPRDRRFRRRETPAVDEAAGFGAALGRLIDHFEHLAPSQRIAALEAAAAGIRADYGLHAPGGAA